MVLGLKLKPASSTPHLPANLDFVLGRITITGAWQGEVTLGCSAELARRAAAAMFGKPPEQADAEEIRDAIGELTNMVGGNFKTILKGECRLSVPSIVDPVLLIRLEPTSEKHQWFECDGGVVFLGIFRQENDS
jgi:CheY-specific phosphatase CheX